jgi:hypothetical protein
MYALVEGLVEVDEICWIIDSDPILAQNGSAGYEVGVPPVASPRNDVVGLHAWSIVAFSFHILAQLPRAVASICGVPAWFPGDFPLRDSVT